MERIVCFSFQEENNNKFAGSYPSTSVIVKAGQLRFNLGETKLKTDENGKF